MITQANDNVQSIKFKSPAKAILEFIFTWVAIVFMQMRDTSQWAEDVSQLSVILNNTAIVKCGMTWTSF